MVLVPVGPLVMMLVFFMVMVMVMVSVMVLVMVLVLVVTTVLMVIINLHISLFYPSSVLIKKTNHNIPSDHLIIFWALFTAQSIPSNKRYEPAMFPSMDLVR